MPGNDHIPHQNRVLSRPPLEKTESQNQAKPKQQQRNASEICSIQQNLQPIVETVSQFPNSII